MPSLEIQSLLSRDLTAAPVPWVEPTAENDWIIRLSKDTSSGSYEVKAALTKDVWNNWQKWSWDLDDSISVLKAVVKWQHNLIEYGAHYNAFLLGQTTEEEFEQEAHAFAYEPKQLELPWLAASVERVFRLTQIDYTPSDMADLFQTDQDSVRAALLEVEKTYPGVRKLIAAPDA